MERVVKSTFEVSTVLPEALDRETEEILETLILTHFIQFQKLLKGLLLLAALMEDFACLLGGFDVLSVHIEERRVTDDDLRVGGGEGKRAKIRPSDFLTLSHFPTRRK